jgi:hypothetical protein
MSMTFYCNKLHLSKQNSSCVFSTKQNMNYKFQPPSTFVFSFLRIWFHLNCLKFCNHLRSLKVSRLGMIEVTGLKVWRRAHLKWLSSFINPLFVQKLLGVTRIRTYRQTDRETDGDLMGLTFLFKERRIAMGLKAVLKCLGSSL